MNAISNKVSAVDRLAESRRELHKLLLEDDRLGSFPRSKTMRLLMSNRGAAFIAAGAGGLLMLRPKLLTNALRAIPLGAVLRMLVVHKLNRRG